MYATLLLWWWLGFPIDHFDLQAVSTLSMLEPFRRAVIGVPFLYQKVYGIFLSNG